MKNDDKISDNDDEKTNILHNESESETSDNFSTNNQNSSQQFDVDDIGDFVHDHGIASSMVIEYEKVIESCGYGWFQRLLLLVCGWAFVSDSIEIQVSVI